MSTPIKSKIGRVQPLFKGEYISDSIYGYLDIIYNSADGCSYVSLQDENSGHTPATSSAYWQKISSTGGPGVAGPTGPAPTLTFGETITLPPGQDASVAVSSGSGTYELTFSIPQGEQGITGSGSVSSIDGIGPVSGTDNVQLNAVRYTIQTLSTSAQLQARNNINAQIAGNYQPAGNYISAPSQLSTNQFLYFDSGGNWVCRKVTEVPAGGTDDINKYLRNTSNGLVWTEVPAISSTEIDSLFNN